jgi:protein-tyrosine phosphatase
MTAADATSIPVTLASSAAFRDLGGAPTRDGRRIAHGRLFRADALSRLDPADRARVDRLGLRLVCDLRSASERNATPCLDWLQPAPRRLRMELSAGLAHATLPWLERLRLGPDAEAARGLMTTTYAELPGSAAPFLARLFEVLVAGEWPLLVHCTAGKDRTGFTIAMILTALDVEPVFIREDYLRGSGRDPLEIGQPSAHMMQALIGRDLTPEEAHAIHSVHGDYLDAASARIDQDWGGPLEYLERAAGLDARGRAVLRDQLLR